MRDYEELLKRLREETREADTFKLMEDLFDAADAIEDLIVALTASNEVIAKSRDKWISVEERLPDPYKEVLLYNGEDYYTGYMHADKRFTLNASHYPSRTTHWMPLSEPPKEDADDSD